MEYTYKISSENKAVIQEYINSQEHIDPDKFVIELNDNVPAFTDDEEQLEERGYYFSELDKGRCGVALARISKSTCSQPQDERTTITCKITGFPTKEENDDEHLVFQRCHLIGYQLFAKGNDKEDNENANKKNLITGTRFMNNVMLYREKMIADYVDGTENYVLYRVTPYFKGSNDVAYGVQMEAKFINEQNEEDKTLSFNIFVYNIQPGIIFDYKTGKISSEESIDLSRKMLKTKRKYVINEKNQKFHIESCASVYDIKSKNEVTKKGEELIHGKYCPCEICIPYWMKGWI
ncbi:MAG: hypothetical protein HDR04_20705 [Lachnospiraceae bacterium]|nr:hypothetical protein [Lachnospiraceae bacterium]